MKSVLQDRLLDGISSDLVGECLPWSGVQRCGAATGRHRAARRGRQGHHRAAAGGRSAPLRDHRPRRRAVRGGRAPAGGPAAGSRGHPDRRGHRPPAAGLPAPGDGRRAHHGRRRGAGRRAGQDARGRLRGDHRRQLRRARRGRLRGRRAPPGAGRTPHPGAAGRAEHRDVRLHEAAQAALQLGDQMTTSPEMVTAPATTPRGTDRAAAARDHLWMHFARHSVYQEGGQVPIMVRGEGCRVWDSEGRSYLDGLSGLFVVQAGHGRRELAEVAARQAEQLAFFPLWSYAHPQAVQLAERLDELAPGDLTRVFFTTGGGEAVETAWKVAKQYWKLRGKPLKHKVISRAVAYHGTPHGALSITGIPAAKEMFEPLVPGAFKVANTNFYRAPEYGHDLEAFGRWAADQIAIAIETEGPDTVAAVFLEPVQNSGGCFPPPPGYFQRVREICDRYDVLLVSDEVICAFGRLGHTFAA